MNLSGLTNPTAKYKIVMRGIDGLRGDKNISVIEGYWNEDNSPFQIICSVQLQEMLLYVLNNLEVDKITIRKSQNCDTRSADKKVSEEELLENSRQHIDDVQRAIDWMISVLRKIAVKHDYTKIENIKEFYNNFKFIQEGNIGEFKKMSWFQNYHLKERHHLTDRCPDDVNLFDVLERVADITMAGLARTGQIYEDTLSPEILTKAYTNTINLIKNNTILLAKNKE